MARIPTIERKEQLAPEHHAVYDLIGRSRGRVAGPFTVLLHSPQIAGRTGELGAYIRFESKLTPHDRELAVITAAREMDCQYEWAAHVLEARKAGVREEAIAAIRDRRAPAGLTADEAQLVNYVRQLMQKHRVDEGTFTAVRERFGVQALVELTATVGYYGMIACTLNAFEAAPAPGEDRLPV